MLRTIIGEGEVKVNGENIEIRRGKNLELMI
jgi:ribosome-associated protein YbcJ (S4-like RNA binding protein)